MGKSIQFRIMLASILVFILSTMPLLYGQDSEKDIEEGGNSQVEPAYRSKQGSSENTKHDHQTGADNGEQENSKDDTANTNQAAQSRQLQPATVDTDKPEHINGQKQETSNQDTIIRDQAIAHELPVEKRVPLFEYHMAYGGFFPIGAYGNRYDPGHLATAGISLYRYNLWGIAPEVIFRYTRLDGIESDDYPDSFFNIFQVSAGLIYRYEFIMYPSARMMTVFARITEGVSIMQYHEEDRGNIEEYINTLGVSVGLSIAVWKELHLGFEAGYRIIFTAGDYMQGFMVNVTVGYRY